MKGTCNPVVLAALLALKIIPASCGSIRSMAQEGTNASLPLEEIVTPDGAAVRFYEAGAGSGILVAASSVPEGSTDPLVAYLDSVGEGSGLKSLKDFYVHLSGREPTGRLRKALGRQTANTAREKKRMNWRSPEELYSASPMEMDSGVAEQPNTECLNCASAVGSKQWWVDSACRSTTPFDWCNCRSFRTGKASYTKTSDDFFQKVYPYRGRINHKLEYWSCSRYGCSWKLLISAAVDQSVQSAIWGEGGGSWSYRGSVYNADGDGYHLSWYDAADSGLACKVGDLGCYVCPNVI